MHRFVLSAVMAAVAATATFDPSTTGPSIADAKHPALRARVDDSGVERLAIVPIVPAGHPIPRRLQRRNTSQPRRPPPEPRRTMPNFIYAIYAWGPADNEQLEHASLAEEAGLDASNCVCDAALQGQSLPAEATDRSAVEETVRTAFASNDAVDKCVPAAVDMQRGASKAVLQAYMALMALESQLDPRYAPQSTHRMAEVFRVHWRLSLLWGKCLCDRRVERGAAVHNDGTAHEDCYATALRGVSPFYRPGTRILKLPRQKRAFNEGEPRSTLLYSAQPGKARPADFLSHFFVRDVRRGDARYAASHTRAEGARRAAAGDIDVPKALAAMRNAWLQPKDGAQHKGGAVPERPAGGAPWRWLGGSGAGVRFMLPAGGH